MATSAGSYGPRKVCAMAGYAVFSFKSIHLSSFLTLAWRWVQFRQAKHPTFWVCDEGCKSGCGTEIANYSHCNLKREENGATNGAANRATNGAANGAANGSSLETKFK